MIDTPRIHLGRLMQVANERKSWRPGGKTPGFGREETTCKPEEKGNDRCKDDIKPDVHHEH